MEKRRASVAKVVLSLALAGAGGTVAWLLLHGRPTVSQAPISGAALPGASLPPDWRLSHEPTPAIEPNAQARAAEAVRAALKASPEQLSTTATLPPFDKQAFERDPKAYLSQVVPARSFQTAAPGPGISPLEVKSPARAAVPSGGELPLWVRGAPGAPVTFTAFDGGQFKENGLPSVTLRADGRGLVVAHFVATTGIGGDVNVVAGSPLSAGVQRFLLRVK